jgi:hypothetical protein
MFGVETMNTKCVQEFVAYSVQDLGGLWRWRVYRIGGQVARHGIEATEAAAERTASNLVFDRALSQAA